MRLWHIDLIPYLPKSQLIAQWRELNSIFKKQDKHILINYVYNYSKEYLLNYSCKVINQLYTMNYKLNMINFNNYFGETALKHWIDIEDLTFAEHNEEYLTICYWNLLNTDNSVYRECKNQPSFFNIEEANDELELYLRECNMFFVEDKEHTKHLDDGYYIELYENEAELDAYELEQIIENNDYPDGTSLSPPIREIFVDNSGKIVFYKRDNDKCEL